MDITRDNYMEWLADFHHGKLSGEQEDLLARFLEENGSLEAESALYDHPYLRPDISLRMAKESLRKDFNDLSVDQKEELLIALSEGDLSHEDSDELAGIIDTNPLLKNFYGVILKTRLAPPDIQFPGKARLKRIPFRQTVRRIGVNSLAAAAVAIILFSLWTLVQREEPVTQSRQVADNTEITPSSTPSASVKETDVTEQPSAQEIIPTTNTPVSTVKSTGSDRADEIISQAILQEVSIPPVEREKIIIDAAPLSTAITLEISSDMGRLAEMVPVEIEPEPINLSPRQFLAKNFRTLILKENSAGTERLRGYEVADATVIGVNKLMGWDMKLDKDKDDEGNLNSLRFTSQLIKFDHRMKNSTDSL